MLPDAIAHSLPQISPIDHSLRECERFYGITLQRVFHAKSDHDGHQVSQLWAGLKGNIGDPALHHGLRLVYELSKVSGQGECATLCGSGNTRGQDAGADHKNWHAGAAIPGSPGWERFHYKNVTPRPNYGTGEMLCSFCFGVKCLEGYLRIVRLKRRIFSLEALWKR